MVSIEMVLLLPIALTLLFLVVQGAVYYHGRSVAMSSAQEGARQAAAREGTNAMGRERALAFADRVGGDGVLEGATAKVHRNPAAGTVTVTVTGRTLSVIPGWDPEVSQSSTRPIEKFSAPREYHRMDASRWRGKDFYETRPLP